MALIPQEIIEQVAAANDIVEVVGGYFPLKRMGGLFKALCPFHQERTPSFSVNQQRQIFKCFGCGMGGGVFRFVQEYEHIDFVSAVRKLAERANIRIPEAEMSSEDYARLDRRRRLLALHAEAADFFHHQLLRGKSATGAREYLKKRGLSAEVAKSWKIGFAPESWDALLNHARAAGFSADELADSGLFSKGDDSDRLFDRFRGRVMFPICNDTGEVIAFSGRVLDAAQSPAKYVNSPETMLFTKGSVLFGLHKAKRALIDKKSAIVMEGQIDLITAYEHGVQNVIAPQGTAFTERQARILKRYVEEVVLCFDADAAGQKAAERSLPYLLSESLLVRVAKMPAGEDPDSMIRTRGAETFVTQIAQAEDFFDYAINEQAARPDFQSTRGKVAAARKLAEFVSLIPDVVTRESVSSNAAVRLGVPLEEFKTLTKKAPAPRPDDGPGDHELSTSQRTEPIEMDATFSWLALVALHDYPSRIWLQARGWDRVLEDSGPAAVLLRKIIDGEFQPGDPSSISAFLSTLEPDEESAVSTLLDRDPPLHPRVIAEDCWHELERRQLTRRRDVLRTRLLIPDLTIDQQTKLAERVMEIQRQIAALPPPSPPRQTD